MKVFISSLITGMEPIRTAAKSAVTTLSHDPIMAEDFGALPHSPQVACLDGVRQAGVVVLILGARYGAVQPSGLSATHEEYREARGRCPVLAFVEDGVTPEPGQDAFIREVQAWDSGLIRAGFTDASQLERKIVQALHRMDVSNAATPFDANEMLARALALFPKERDSHSAVLSLAVVGGPAQPILRPSQIEAPDLAEALEKEALYGPTHLFLRGGGITSTVDEEALILEQTGQRGRDGRLLRLDPQGGVLVRSPIESESGGLPAVLVETVQQRLVAGLRYAAWALDHVDRTQRLSHVTVVAQLVGSFGMRTRREHEASPNSMSMGSSYGRNQHSPVHLSPAHLPRAALSQQADQLVEELMTLLRRQRK